MSTKNRKLVWLYPDLMNTYGDRGNVRILAARAQLAGLTLDVLPLSIQTDREDFAQCLREADIYFMGGAQDAQQEIVANHLSGELGEILVEKISSGTPGLYICGAFQLLGREYVAANGKQLRGLGVFDCITRSANPGEERLIGDCIIESDLLQTKLYGFENHGGRTILGNTAQPLGKVLKGWGNDGTGNDEGIVFQSSIGSYLHGCMLAKNPSLADWLLSGLGSSLENQKNGEVTPTGLLEALSIDVLERRAAL